MLRILCTFLFQSLNKLHKYCINAVNGFFRSIALSSGNSLQDTLRLLTLWFDYGQWSDVYDALVDGLKTIQIDNWLQVDNDCVCTSVDPSHKAAMFSV